MRAGGEMNMKYINHEAGTNSIFVSVYGRAYLSLRI